MDVTLSAVSTQSLSSVAEALKSTSPVAADVPASPVLGGENISVGRATPARDAVLAQLRMETNDARLNAARHRLASALSQLENLSGDQKSKVEEMKAAGSELADAETVRDVDKSKYDEKGRSLASKKSDLSDAQEALAAVTGNPEATQDDIDAATERLQSAQRAYDSAKAEHDAAKEKYDSSERIVGEKQNKFDELVKSLDMASLTALRDALKMSAADVDHLHEEIEEDDKKHDISPTRSVEDVISDALKRLDGKMVDEIEDRHLDHV